MTTTFRKTLMATTVLAGLAIFSFDAAQAGPNGGPSLGNISGFSSMRMDFNRVGGPNRALSRDDTRVVPLDVKKAEKPKDTKNAAKKGTDIARVSNPKSAGGGKGKEVASAPALRIPAPLAELYRVTGGNLDDISRLAELASWLQTGLPALGSPLFDKGDGRFVPPTLGAGDRYPWGDAESGSGNNTPQQIGNPDGKVAGDAWRNTREGYGSNGHISWIESYNKQENRYRITYFEDDGHVVRNYAPGREPGTSLPVSTTRFIEVTDDTVITAGEESSEKEAAEKETTEKEVADKETTEKETTEKETTEKEKDSQPTEEGTGRSRGMHTVRCDIAGCLDLGMKDGRRVNPGHGNPDGSSSADTSGGGLPSWATDPCPDCGGRVSGGGGFRRPGGSDLGWRGNGGGDGGFNPLPAPH